MNLLKAVGVFILALVVLLAIYEVTRAGSEAICFAVSAVVAIFSYIHFRGGAVKTAAEIAANTMNTKDRITEQYSSLRQDKVDKRAILNDHGDRHVP